MGFFDILANQAANTLPGAVIGTGMGLLLQKNNDRRQLEMQQKLQNMQIAGQQAMTNFNMEKQLQLWKDTSYGAQKEQMKIAGLNPALMYGMGGGGGQTAALAQGNVSGGEAPKGGGEIPSMMGISLQSQQLELLQAQKENIQADTASKKADALLKGENKIKLELENIINDLMVNRDLEGNLITGPDQDHKRAAFQGKKADIQFKIDENQRQNLMNSAVLQKLAEHIELMKTQGKNLEQITSNLEKEGALKEMEVEWSKIGLTRESFGKFIQLVILKLLK